MPNPRYISNQLYTKRINSWIARAKGDPAPYTFEHWTRHGTFRLSPKYLAGSLQCEIYLDNQLIGTCALPNHAASALANGQFDDELGFSVSGSGLPADLSDWGRS